jgi:hypothetical protein
VSRKRRGAAGAIAGLAAFVVISSSRTARAAPQVSSTLAFGAAGRGDRSKLWSSTDFVAGLRGVLLLGRTKDTDFGLGPYAEALTMSGFSDLQLGGGASLLVPVHPYLPLTLSAGGFAAHDAGLGWYPGIAGELFWGSHGYNYESAYALSAGLFAGARYGLEPSHDVTILVGARLDLEIIALPFILLWNAARGGDPAR